MALLLVPASERERPKSTRTDGQVSVYLLQPFREEPEPGDTIAPTLQPVSARAEEIRLPDKEPPLISESPPARPTTRELIESIGRDSPFPVERKVRRLGDFDPPDPPRNWLPSKAFEDERLGGAALPERIEIVDRWLAADGSHNVLLRIPGGEILCGRAQPWDPLRPLFEPVMMYRQCGRGGMRTFDMPERYKRARP